MYSNQRRTLLQMNYSDEYFMQQALKEAQKAAKKDEVPVGAVVVMEGRIIARAHNGRETTHDPCAHAEINALRKAGKKLGGWNLHKCELYVTLEPCPMCAGAAINARIKRIIYGASDPKAGCCGTLYNFCTQDSGFNHHPDITPGVLQIPCGQILSGFFRQKRKKDN